MCDNGGGSSGANTAVLVDKLVQIDQDGFEGQRRDEQSRTDGNWTQPSNWVAFDDTSNNQSIVGEERLPAKSIEPEDDGLNCLRPPPYRATIVPRGETNGVSQPAREVVAGHEHLSSQSSPAAGPHIAPHYGPYNPQLHSSPAVSYAGNVFAPGVEPVQWLPEVSQRCQEAIRHYTVCTSSHHGTMTEMRPLYNVPVVEQPQPVEKGWGGRLSPGKPPSNVYLVFTIVVSFLSIFCCLCTGVAAFVVALQAYFKRDEGKNAEARQKLTFALGLVAASIFFFAPTIIIVVLTHAV